jgi:hypothetical protein
MVRRQLVAMAAIRPECMMCVEILDDASRRRRMSERLDPQRLG